MIFLSKIILYFSIVFCIFFVKNLRAAEVPDEFACIGTQKGTFKNGPGKKFETLFTVNKQGYPFKIVKSVDNWFAIEDFMGDTGWIYSGEVKRKCGAIVRPYNSPDPFALVYRYPYVDSPVLFKIETGFVLTWVDCKISASDMWCKTRIRNKLGWVKKEDLWGVL